jgi:hypothetical protein
MPRKWSPAQREAQRQRMLRHQAEKRGEEPTIESVVMSPDAAASELKELAASLAKAADDKSERTRALDSLETFLRRLSPKDYPDLADSEIVQKFIERIAERKVEANKDDPPGTIYNRGTIAQFKKPWTERDLALSGMGMIEFETAEPECVIWNGIRRDYEPGVPYRDYKCFLDTIREKNRNLRLAGEHAEYMFKMRSSLTDRSIATLGTARIRGTADRGSYRPAAGLFTPEYAVSGLETEEE